MEPKKTPPKSQRNPKQEKIIEEISRYQDKLQTHSNKSIWYLHKNTYVNSLTVCIALKKHHDHGNLSKGIHLSMVVA